MPRQEEKGNPILPVDILNRSLSLSLSPPTREGISIELPISILEGNVSTLDGKNTDNVE
jgi:hypothetical protein